MTESIEATVWHRDKLQDKVKCHVKYIDDLKEPQVRNRVAVVQVEVSRRVEAGRVPASKVSI